MNNKAGRILDNLKKHGKVLIEDNFDKFMSSQNLLKRVLVMSHFKRTFKLLMSVNMNIPVVSIDWLDSLITNQDSVSLERFFLKRTNRSNVNYDKLKAAFFYRKHLKRGFLTGHNIIGNWLLL